MKRLLDVNLWIALVIERHENHKRSRKWLESVALDPGDLLLCRHAEMGFLRLVTQKSVMNNVGLEPLSNVDAMAFLEKVVQDLAVELVDEPFMIRELWYEFASTDTASSKVWADAYLAAFAVRLGAQMVTFDQGFVVYCSRGLNLELLGDQ